LFPDNYNADHNLEDISTSISCIDYTHNNTSTSIDQTNVLSTSTISELINCSPSTSTYSVSSDTINRYSPYTNTTSKTINSAVPTSFQNHPKYGTYLPMDWTNEVRLYSLTIVSLNNLFISCILCHLN